MDPRFSVIVPIYNVENYIRQCVDSLVSQKNDKIEILLVDDGSPDNCGSICDEYAKMDSRIKVIHKKNGGLVSARQAGCKAAKGEYIVNVDGDDWVKPNYFETLDTIVEQHHPDYICFGAFHVQGKEETPHYCNVPAGVYDEHGVMQLIFPQLIEDKRGEYFSPAVWSKAIKRTIYENAQMNVDDRIKIGEDHACTKPALVMSKSLVIIRECLYCYRINPQSMTKEKRAFSLDGPKLIGQNFEKQIDMQCCDFQKQVYRSVVHHLFNAIITQFNRKEKYAIIRNDISNALNSDYYKNAIIKCEYDDHYIIGKIIRFLLKNKMIEALALIAVLKSKS